MARLTNKGILKEFLDENCPKKQYKFCEYKDHLSADYSDFLWNPNSEFNQNGGWDLNAHTEYGLIISDLLHTPKYFLKLLKNSFSNSMHQLITFKIGDGISKQFDEASPQYQAISRNFHSDELPKFFFTSKQARGLMFFDKLNRINLIFMILSVIIIVISTIVLKYESEIFLFQFIVVAGYIANAIASAGLADYFDRFQSRVSWMLIFLMLILVYQLANQIISNKLKEKTR
jgi:hypothetical protein